MSLPAASCRDMPAVTSSVRRVPLPSPVASQPTTVPRFEAARSCLAVEMGPESLEVVTDSGTGTVVTESGTEKAGFW